MILCLMQNVTCASDTDSQAGVIDLPINYARISHGLQQTTVEVQYKDDVDARLHTYIHWKKKNDKGYSYHTQTQCYRFVNDDSSELKFYNRITICGGTTQEEYDRVKNLAKEYLASNQPGCIIN